MTLTLLERHLIGRVPAGLAIPVYGSPEFDALEAQDPRRAASVIRAAAAWRDHCSPERVAEELRRQLADEDEAVWQRIRETSYDASAAIDWASVSRMRTLTEIQQARAS